MSVVAHTFFLFILILNFRLTHHSSPPRGALSIPEQERGGVDRYAIGTLYSARTGIERDMCFTLSAYIQHTESCLYRWFSPPLLISPSYYFILSSPHSLRVARWPRPNR